MPFHPEQFRHGVFTYGSEYVCLEPVLFVVFAVGLVWSVGPLNGQKATVDATMRCYLHISIGEDYADGCSH
jgi:hypothetical protein